MPRIAQAGRNPDFCYLRLPSFWGLTDNGDNAVPHFVKWSGIHVCLTDMEEETIDDDVESLKAYYLVVDLRGCESTAMRNSRKRSAHRIHRNILNAKKEGVHPQFVEDTALYAKAKEAKKANEHHEFYSDHDLLPYLTAIITTISIPYISIAGGISPEATEFFTNKDVDVNEYLSECGIPPILQLPWPEGCWMDGDKPPVETDVVEIRLARIIKDIVESSRGIRKAEIRKAIKYLSRIAEA